MAAVRAGDDRAFERLYERYRRRIAAYVQGMVHDHARAEDITQDVFMSALRRMRDTERPIAFKPWIYEIAKNACIDQFRRSRRAEEVSFDAEEGPGAGDVGRLASPRATPDVAMDTKQQLDDLRGAFGGLSQTHHDILVMRELEGLSYREIGDRLGMTRAAVESTLFRARRRLEEEYEELVTGKRCLRVQDIIGGATARTIGVRDHRRMARHVSHCQPCRRHARLAGLQVDDLAPATLRGRIAAVLPLPAFLRRRASGEDPSGAALGAQVPASAAQWSSTVAGALDPAIAGWGKAAVAAATLALAGLGAGAVTQERIAAGDRTPSAGAALAAPGPDTQGAGAGARAGAAMPALTGADGSGGFPLGSAGERAGRTAPRDPDGPPGDMSLRADGREPGAERSRTTAPGTLEPTLAAPLGTPTTGALPDHDGPPPTQPVDGDDGGSGLLDGIGVRPPEEPAPPEASAPAGGPAAPDPGSAPDTGGDAGGGLTGAVDGAPARAVPDLAPAVPVSPATLPEPVVDALPAG